MAIFLIATGPALSLLARLTELRADRKHTSLKSKMEINPLPWSNVTLSYNHTELERLKARNRGDTSK